MAETIRTLAVDILFNADPKPLDDLEKALKGFVATTGFASLSVGGLAHALFGIVEHTTEYADALEKTASRLGLTTQELEQYQFALKATGDLAAEDVTTGLSMFVRVLGDATLGSQQATKALNLAGVDMKAFGGQTPTTSQAILLVAERLKAIKNPAIQASIATDLFGRQAGPKFVGALSKGSEELARFAKEAEDVGAVLSSKAIEAASHFDHTLKVLRGTLRGLTHQIGGELLIAIGPTVEAFQEFLKENRAELVKNISALFKAMGTYIKIVGKALKEVAKGFKTLVNFAGGFERLINLAAEFLAIMVSFKILVSLGLVIKAIVGVVNAFDLAKSAAKAFQLTAVAGPALIALAFLVVIALFEDIYQYMTGGKNLVGIFLDPFFAKFLGFKTFLQETFDSIFNPIFNIINMVTEGTFTWMGALKSVGDIILNSITLPMRTALGLIEGVSSLFSKVTGIGGGVADAANKARGAIAVSPLTNGVASSVLATSPQGTGVPGAQAPSVSNSNQNNLNANMNITIGAGANSTEVVKSVQQGAEQAFQGILKQSSRNTTPAVAY